MAAIDVTYWSRRDSADRAMLGQTAFDLCKAQRAAGAVADSKFYWLDPDTVVVQVTAESPADLNQEPTADTSRALFELADLARQTRHEQWLDPRTGQDNYRLAGR